MASRSCWSVCWIVLTQSAVTLQRVTSSSVCVYVDIRFGYVRHTTYVDVRCVIRRSQIIFSTCSKFISVCERIEYTLFIRLLYALHTLDTLFIRLIR